jgi:hypothetical protein
MTHFLTKFSSKIWNNISISFYLYGPAPKQPILAGPRLLGSGPTVNVPPRAHHREALLSGVQLRFSREEVLERALAALASDGAVSGGPTGLPGELLDLPLVNPAGREVAGLTVALTVLQPDGARHRGPIVAFHKPDGRVLGEGFTDSAGRLSIYGAEPGDTGRAASFDAGLARGVEIGGSPEVALTLRPVGGAVLGADGYLRTYVSSPCGPWPAARSSRSFFYSTSARRRPVCARERTQGLR